MLQHVVTCCNMLQYVATICFFHNIDWFSAIKTICLRFCWSNSKFLHVHHIGFWARVEQPALQPFAVGPAEGFPIEAAPSGAASWLGVFSSSRCGNARISDLLGRRPPFQRSTGALPWLEAAERWGREEKGGGGGEGGEKVASNFAKFLH